MVLYLKPDSTVLDSEAFYIPLRLVILFDMLKRWNATAQGVHSFS